MKPRKTRELILDFLETNPNATIREIMVATGCKSTTTVDDHITN